MIEYEQVGWASDWPEGYTLKRSFMYGEPKRDADKWYPVYRKVDSGAE